MRAMQMNETAILVTAPLAGVLLGTLFYGGLWWTVLRSVSSKTLSARLAGSFLLRAMISVCGFYFVSHGEWRRLLACLLGFTVSRVAVTRLTRMQRPVP
jgi:F1F0 ATPase subunit 2